MVLGFLPPPSPRLCTPANRGEQSVDRYQGPRLGLGFRVRVRARVRVRVRARARARVAQLSPARGGDRASYYV